jgi:hypothetical protein
MRFTQSQARAQAVKEAQASLLRIALAQNAHTSLIKNLEVSTPLPTILKNALLKLFTNCRASVLGVIVAPVPSFVTKKPAFLLQVFKVFLF